MKIQKMLSLILVLSLVGIVATGCSKKVATTTTTTTEVTVGTGNITVSITSTGSMDYSDYENLSFATDGTVGAVNVKVGDLVTKGQVLATLDSDAWNTYLASLTKAVQTAQSNLTAAQGTITTDQRQVATKQLGVQSAQLGVTQAQLGVQTAQNNLDNLTALKPAQDAVEVAQANVDAAQASLLIAAAQGDAEGVDFLNRYINGDPSIPGSTGLKGVLTQAQKNLKDVLSGTSITLSNNVNLQITSAQLQVSSAQLQVLQAQDSLVSAQAAVDTANTAVTNAQANEADAEQAVKDAQTAVDTAKTTSLQITAPFDGAITTMSITQSSAIKKGATAIVIADTSKFKASLMVNETDISNIRVGTMATITATAIPNVTLNARVTAISPVASIQSGVVNYAVTATILGVAAPTRAATSTTPAGESGTTTTPSTTTGQSTTTTPSISGQSGATTTPATTGRQRIITTGAPGQSGTSIIPPTDLPSGDGGQFSNLTPDQIAQFQQGLAARQSNATASTTAQLRQGLSLTVNLIEQQALNVITVPNTAIKTISGKTYVQVKNSSGTPEQREVTTGLKDYQNTEIVSGLAEGEVILITKTSSSTVKTTTTTQAPAFNIGGGIIR
jgi:HlyD family secretion protein